MKMGRWRSDTFLEYIAEGISSFSEGMSKAMKKTFQYVNVQAGASSDVVELTEEVCRGGSQCYSSCCLSGARRWIVGRLGDGVS